MRPTYRSDIDGLRAVAVLLVVGFHAFPFLVPGGYVGVDIFFVISGYLISGIIIGDLSRGRFSYSDFYLRRVRRIFPALVLTLLAAFVGGWIFFLPEAFAALGKNIVGGAAFVANFTLWAQSGYFDFTAEYLPLLHLWSLGIEEQFYLLWPPVLYFAFPRWRNLFWLATVLAIASCTINLFLVKTDPQATFYLLPTRAWELMVGAMLAIAEQQGAPHIVVSLIDRIGDGLATILRQPGRDDRLENNIRAVCGLVLIIGAVIFLHRYSTYPGWRALLPTIGAMLLLSAPDAFINRQILSVRCVVAVGLVSYPLYLWHWPLLVFLPRFDVPLTLPAIKVLAIVLSMGLAWATYVFVERPIRFSTARWRVGAPLTGIMAVVGAAGIFVVAEGGVDWRLDYMRKEFNGALQGARADALKEWKRGTCLFETSDSIAAYSPSCLDVGKRPLVMVWGDSLAAALIPGLRGRQQTDHFGLGQITTAGCPPILSFEVRDRPHCKENNDFAFQLIRSSKPDVVVLHSFWNYPNLTTRNIVATIADLQRLGVTKIVIIGPPVSWAPSLPETAMKYSPMLSVVDPLRINEFLDASTRQRDRE